MFRRKPKSHLKEMEEWPTALDGFGTFLNPTTDQIRLICRPGDKMIYKLTDSMEYNDRRLAAFRRASPISIPCTLRLTVQAYYQASLWKDLRKWEWRNWGFHLRHRRMNLIPSFLSVVIWRQIRINWLFWYFFRLLCDWELDTVRRWVGNLGCSCNGWRDCSCKIRCEPILTVGWLIGRCY